MTGHQIVGKDEWLIARQALLSKEFLKKKSSPGFGMHSQDHVRIYPAGKSIPPITLKEAWVKHHDKYKEA